MSTQEDNREAFEYATAQVQHFAETGKLRDRSIPKKVQDQLDFILEARTNVSRRARVSLALTTALAHFMGARG